MFYQSRQKGLSYFSVIRTLELAKDTNAAISFYSLEGSFTIPVNLLNEIQDAIMKKKLMPRHIDIKNFIQSKLN